jgi:hypothetical protein
MGIVLRWSKAWQRYGYQVGDEQIVWCGSHSDAVAEAQRVLVARGLGYVIDGTPRGYPLADACSPSGTRLLARRQR